MKKDFIIVGVICLILASLAGADYLATTISTDGSVMVATTGSDQNGSFASRVMGLDSTDMHRSVSGGEEAESDLTVRSEGPLLFADFASAIWQKPDLNSLCTLIGNSGGIDQEASVYTSGIVRQGQYTLMRSIGSGLTGETAINGTGLMVFGSQKEGNHSVSGHGFVSGNMTVRDLVQYGGRL